MSHLNNANICEVNDGPYYKVKLSWLPRTGDFIELYSFVDAETKNYEVVRVIHNMYDVAEKIPQSHDGKHFVTIHVKPSNERLK